MSTTIAVNNAVVLYGLSPYNWYQNGSTSLTSVNPGAYIKFNFTGTSLAVVVDMTNVNATGTGSGTYPVIAYTVDGVRSTFQLTSASASVVVATGLADATHTFQLDFIGTDESGNTDRWNTPSMALVITSFTLDTAKTVTQVTLNPGGYYLSLGDSIKEGAVVLAAASNPPYYAGVEDATKSYAKLIADYFQMEYGNCSFAGQSWTGGVSNVPGLPTSYTSLFSGQARSFVPTPNIVTVNMGTNGSVTAGVVTSFMTSLRASVGAGAQIMMIIPFSQANVSAITTGYNNYVSGAPTDVRVTLIDLSTTGSSIVTANSYDSVHPNTAGHQLLFNALVSSLVNPKKPGRTIRPTATLAGAF